MIEEQPLISIPVLTYNGEKFLREQLDSIFAQTYKNIEVIACDDGSTDDTQNILKEYERTHGLICHFNIKNIGVSKNLATALSLCNGSFIAPSDQDDIWNPEKLHILTDHIGENVLIYSPSTAIDQYGAVIKNFTPPTQKLIRGHNNKAFFLDNCVSGHTIMFKHELIKHIIPIPDAVYPDWWIAFVASTYGSIDYFEKSLVYYRRHDTQMTRHRKKEKRKIHQKIMRKEEEKKSSVQRKIDILAAFSSLNILNPETRSLLHDIISEYKKFSTSYYNKKLVSLLHQHQNEIFAMTDEGNHSKLIKHHAFGLWYYRMKLYT